MVDCIEIKGLSQNNLKNIFLSVPKNKIVVFTGVSGSGKSSIVFDTIASESQRQMNETYSAWIRGRLPKYEKPKVENIENLSASVIVDQTRLGGNSRSTVGTISDMYSVLRLIFSRVGKPYIGTSSYFSFNDPNGMCPKCSGLGKVMKIDIEGRIDPDKSWNEGMADLPAFHVGNWYWKKYKESGLFPVDKKYRDFTDVERSRLFYGSDEKGGKQLDKNVEGIETYLSRMLLRRDTSELKEPSVIRLTSLLHEETCPMCRGKRLGRMALVPKIIEFLPVRNADIHNLKNVNVDIPLGVLTVITGVAGSGKSSLIRDVFAKQYSDRAVLVNQSPITATNRSTPVSFLEIFDEIRNVIAKENGVSAGLFSFNSEGGCPHCGGKGYITTEIGHAECGSGEYKVVLEEKYRSGLTGLDGFSHLQIVWWFSGCDNAEDRSILTIEKPYTKGPEKMGTFATRSPERPNPIAVSTCAVKKIDSAKGIIYLDYFDAFTGTLILDIKPYTPSIDKVENPSVPGWCSHWPKNYETSDSFDWEKEFNF